MARDCALVSAKYNVERLLGTPTDATDKLMTYRLDRETVFISLITEGTASADLKILRPGTVRDIQVVPKDTVVVTDLGIDEKRIVRTEGSKPEYAGFFGYLDLNAGFIVVTNGKSVERVFYFADVKDRLKCPACTIDPQTIADVPLCILCPTVAVSCPEIAEPGVAITFTANVTVGTPAPTLTYHWTVSAGSITEGQGTSSITVSPTNLTGKTVTTTVEVDGIDPSCNRTASCSTVIRKP